MPEADIIPPDQGSSHLTSQAAGNSAASKVPTTIHVELTFGQIPRQLLIDLLEKLAEPRKKTPIATFFKDMVPVVISAATVVVTIAVGYSTYSLNKTTTENSENVAQAAYHETLGNLITEVSSKKVGESEDQATSRVSLAALRLAVYEEKALPAIRATFATRDPDSMEGGALVARQIYLSETIERVDLMKAMLTYYRKPVLRLGVMVWADKMGEDLTEEDSMLLFKEISVSFGEQGKSCGSQDGEVALRAANYLQNHYRIVGSQNLALGLIENCPQSGDYDSARLQAALALQDLIPVLQQSERTTVVARLHRLSGAYSGKLKQRIDSDAKLAADIGDQK